MCVNCELAGAGSDYEWATSKSQNGWTCCPAEHVHNIVQPSSGMFEVCEVQYAKFSSQTTVS